MATAAAADERPAGAAEAIGQEEGTAADERPAGAAEGIGQEEEAAVDERPAGPADDEVAADGRRRKVAWRRCDRACEKFGHDHRQDFKARAEERMKNFGSGGSSKEPPLSKEKRTKHTKHIKHKKISR